METNLLSTLATAHRQAGELELADRALDRMEALSHRLLYPPELARDLIAGIRMANRLAEGAAPQARELLPGALRGVAAWGNANSLGWGAELLAGLLALEDDPAGAAGALGMSQVIRGAFHRGKPELRALAAELTGRLGEDVYREAYRQGAGMPRRDALNRLSEHAGRPVTSPAP
jgi:hypothetical protein